MKRSFLTFAGMFLTLCALGGAGENGEQLVFFSESSENVVSKTATIYGNPAYTVFCGDSVNLTLSATFEISSDLEILNLGESITRQVEYSFGITGTGCYDGHSHNGQGNGLLTKRPFLELSWKERNVGWIFTSWEVVEGSYMERTGLMPIDQHSCDGPVELPPATD